jgi:hypothetical protein
MTMRAPPAKASANAPHDRGGGAGERSAAHAPARLGAPAVDEPVSCVVGERARGEATERESRVALEGIDHELVRHGGDERARPERERQPDDCCRADGG